MDGLFLSSQVWAGLADPVGRADRKTHRESHGIFERLGLVRHARRYAERFTGAGDDFCIRF
jgi:hypothetical protein